MKTVLKQGVMLVVLFLFAVACHDDGAGQGEGGETDGAPLPSISGNTSGKDVYVITSEEQLIGGPLADAEIEDVLMQNDKIRLIIQKPNHHSAAFGGTAGGTIVDADLKRPEGEPGEDNLLDLFPAFNLEYTVNYQHLDILESDLDKYGFVRVRASGVIDVQEYLPPSLAIAGMAAGKDPLTGHYPERFQNALDPLNTRPEYQDLNQEVVTDYILYRGASFVEIRTTLENTGDEPIPLHVGNWFSASGNMEYFIPHLYFANPFLDMKLEGDISGIVYSAFEDRESKDTNVSYAYVHDPRPFKAASPEAVNGTAVVIQGVVVVVPGQQPFKFGEEGPGLLPVCDFWDDFDACVTSGDATYLAQLPPGQFTYSTYMSVGDGSVGDALDKVYDAVGVATTSVSGRVLDENGLPAANARLLFRDDEGPATLLTTQNDGSFLGRIPSGGSWVAEKFGSGRYQVEVYKEGYVVKSGPAAGTCTPNAIDVRNGNGVQNIACTLGDTVELALGDISDEVSGEKIPATLIIAGFDPSQKTDLFGDVGYNKIPYGLVDVLFYHPDGSYHGHHHRPQGASRKTLYLEPGTYEFIYHRGPEYEVEVRRMVLTGGKVSMNPMQLKRIVETSGFISQDYHIHSRNSLDVPVSQERRALNAAAVGLDLLISGDHDVITRYDDVIESEGLGDWLASAYGEEVTPLSMGHFLASFLSYDETDPSDGGALDYTADSRDEVNAKRDYSQPLQAMFDAIRGQSEGEEVIHVAHILHQLLGYMTINGLVTSNELSTDPFSTFADPVYFRLGDPPSGGPPYESGAVDNFSLDFDAVELGVGTYKKLLDQVMASSLPTAFNLFNLGKKVTMSMNSDVHMPMQEAMGSVRNYCRSPVDPLDQADASYKKILTREVQDEIAKSVKNQACLMTNGPYLTVTLGSGEEAVGLGETLVIEGGGTATLKIAVEAPKWVEWDQVDIYVNTVPEPQLGDGQSERDFHMTPKVPTYAMTPSYRLSTGDGSLTVTVADGKRSSTIEQAVTITEDSWIVVMVRGNDGISNHSYPFDAMDFSADPPKEDSKDDSNSPLKLVDNLNDRFLKGEIALTGGVPFFAIANPLFVDTDGDTNSDGDPWEAIYIRDGSSPLAQ